MAPEIHFLPEQQIDLRGFAVEGLVLDVGGGGEGVIGRIGGDRVVAIDTKLTELAEADSPALKIRMDARDLQFLPGTFDMVTSFFTLMYVDGLDRRQVLAESFRMLKPGGRMYIWEPTIPDVPAAAPPIVAIRVKVLLPGGEVINTGYGTAWSGHEQDLESCRALAGDAGFSIIDAFSTRGEESFHLVLERP